MNESVHAPEFLQKKFRMGNAPEVVSSAERKARHSGLAIPDHDYSGRIQTYLDRLMYLINPPKLEKHPNFDRGQRNLRMLKSNLYDQIIIKPEEIPASYWQSIVQKHEEEGRPIEAIPVDVKHELSETLIRDQEESLDIWINYLASPDCKWPDWFKYYALRSVLVMGRYDKGKKKFTERSKTGKSVGQFPELLRDAADFVCDVLIKKQKNKLSSLKYGHGIKPEEKTEFKKLLDESDPNFARLYAWAIDKYSPISEELLQETRGQWVRYPQGSDPKLVASALAQYGTGWCIRGERTAATYLKTSDLEIYFSLDKDDKPVVPRIVIVTRDGRIDEVRGVAKEEHWDSYITDVVEQKLAGLPDGQEFKKRVADMQKMTKIHRKCFLVDKKTGVRTYLNPGLTREELVFLYEIEGKIEGFGCNIPDPRIKEVRDRRNSEEDMVVIFSCSREQIARSVGEIRPDTKAYIGKLTQGIFDVLPPQIEYIYTSFLEGRIRKESLLIGGKTTEQLEALLTEQGIKISWYAQDMLRSKDFQPLEIPENITTIRMKVGDFGFDLNPTTDELYERAKAFGLELCPAETGPHMRLVDVNQPRGKEYYIAMKPITDRYDHPTPHIFTLVHREGFLWLDHHWASPMDRWDLNFEVVFRLRK